MTVIFRHLCFTLQLLEQMEDGQETRQRMVNDKLTVSELATTALVALPPVVPLAELADTLRACRYQTFPVSLDVHAALRSGLWMALEICVSVFRSACAGSPNHFLDQSAQLLVMCLGVVLGSASASRRMP